MPARSSARDPRHPTWAWMMSRGGMTYREVAECLGYPLSTITGWIRRCNNEVERSLERVARSGL